MHKGKDREEGEGLCNHVWEEQAVERGQKQEEKGVVPEVEQRPEPEEAGAR
jgi:hypothetical protein